MSDTERFQNSNSCTDESGNNDSLLEAVKSFRSPYSAKTMSDEEIKAFRRACLDDSTKMIEYLDPKLQENQNALKRHVDAIEKIAEEARRLSDSSMSMAKNSEIQSELALNKSKKSDVKGRIAVFISTLALLIEIILNRQELLAFFESVISLLQSILQTI